MKNLVSEPYPTAPDLSAVESIITESETITRSVVTLSELGIHLFRMQAFQQIVEAFPESAELPATLSELRQRIDAEVQRLTQDITGLKERDRELLKHIRGNA